MEQLRRKLAASILWCSFLVLYLGGVFLLVIGLVFASQTWWAVIQRHAGMWEVGTKTAELLVLAIGFCLALIIPILQHHAVGRSSLWRAERRSEIKGRFPVTNQN